MRHRRFDGELVFALIVVLILLLVLFGWSDEAEPKSAGDTNAITVFGMAGAVGGGRQFPVIGEGGGG